ncbi:hypothetical protein, partial [Silvimonas sp.]|uniref:hypothetical protein n=1 Tax=Silvimonas sp. TaxID=2650811 RepID=UPI002848620C
MDASFPVQLMLLVVSPLGCAIFTSGYGFAPCRLEIPMRSFLLRSLSVALPLLFACTLLAQDTRQVTEPRIPAACVTLDAAIAAPNGVIAEKDEKSLDTVRIQSAIDSCAQGKAVVLRAKGKANVFITGPLELRPGVTLVVEKNTALVAARDPRLYDLAPGT